MKRPPDRKRLAAALVFAVAAACLVPRIGSSIERSSIAPGAAEAAGAAWLPGAVAGKGG